MLHHGRGAEFGRITPEGEMKNRCRILHAGPGMAEYDYIRGSPEQECPATAADGSNEVAVLSFQRNDLFSRTIHSQEPYRPFETHEKIRNPYDCCNSFKPSNHLYLSLFKFIQIDGPKKLT
jgi:hypothetical protein